MLRRNGSLTSRAQLLRLPQAAVPLLGGLAQRGVAEALLSHLHQMAVAQEQVPQMDENQKTTKNNRYHKNRYHKWLALLNGKKD